MTPLEQALESLKLGDIEARALAVDELAKASSRFAEQAVEAMASQVPGRIFVAERLAKFGSLAVPPLERLLGSTNDAQVRVLAAAVLTQLGVGSGLPVLVDTVERGNVEVCLAASWLARSRAAEAADVIERRLETCAPGEVDLVVCLLTALETVGRSLRPDLRRRYSGPTVAPHLRAVVERTS